MSAPGVLYLAPGGSRVAAAAVHLAALAAEGRAVVAVVADVAEWSAVSLPASVTVHRVPADPREAVKAARRLVLGRGGLLADIGVVVAGDLEAAPVAWMVGRRRPDLPIRFEPAGDPVRRPAAADLAVVTSRYPAPADPLGGEYVRSAVAALGARFERVSVLHTDEWRAPRGTSATPLITVTMERLAARADPVVVVNQPEAELTRVTVPHLAGPREYLARAVAQLDAARAALPAGRIDAPLVHAYDGMFGGVVAAELARPDARVVIIESAPRLPSMLAQPDARKRYERVVQRADEVLCVSQHLRDVLAEHFPSHTAKFRVVPSIVDVDALSPRPAPPKELSRWLHVGPPRDRNGLSPVIEALGEIAATDPAVTLTLVHAAETTQKLRDRIRELKLRERVTFLPAMPGAELGELLREHDVLVHTGQPEAFGEVLVQAVVTGTPVLAVRQPDTEQTLTVLSDVAASMVEVAQETASLVAGFRSLGDRLDRFDVATARAALRARYGPAAVLPQLTGADRTAMAVETGPTASAEPVVAAPPVTPAAAPTPPQAATERIVLVAINAPRFYPARDLVLRAAEAGLGVDVITDNANLWRAAATSPRVRIHPVDVAESRRPMLRFEQALVYRAPGKVLAAVREQTRRRESIWPELGVLNAQRAHRKLAKLVHNSGFERGYRVVRPRVMWRVVRREVLPKLDLARTRRVVVAGTNGLTIGWQLARRYPEIQVTTSLNGYE
ncbi:glycosyltransferase family 4 protein [Micromonospora sp. NBC_00617]|uniref:glycosyltransferase family 4 protein n=1 Tax=Micromonospora sp. NBC_00617 TaxID=2903587 RepID=UPI0030DF2FAA